VEGASILAKAAKWLILQTAMSPVLAITLALIGAMLALVAVFAIAIAIFNHFKNSTPEAKLEKTKESTQAAAEAADTAAETYDRLVESLENLSDKYKTLEDLAQGTKEWRDAVRELNSEVLELVEQYPKLASYVKNEDGVLKLDIESDEVQGVLDQYEKDVAKTRSASLAGKIAVLEAQNKVDYEALSDDTKLGE
jgi:archaellum component FlaC